MRKLIDILRWFINNFPVIKQVFDLIKQLVDIIHDLIDSLKGTEPKVK